LWEECLRLGNATEIEGSYKYTNGIAI